MPNVCSPTDPRYTFVGSDFGPRPGRTTGEIGWHAGLDFNFLAHDPSVPELGGMTGFPVYAVGDGIVVYTAADRPAPGSRQFTTGYGNVVVIKHDQWSDGPWFTLYAHLLDMRVETGRRVNVGEQIARVGATSNGEFGTMGAHLHFETRCHPMTAIAGAGPGDIIPSPNSAAYFDWQAGRRTFQTRRTQAGTTVDPIWWFEQRGMRILRRTDPANPETNRKGRILGGSGPLGQAMNNRGVLASYTPARLPAGASYGRGSARAETASMGGLHGLGATPPDEVRITTGSSVQTLLPDTSDLPYQPIDPLRIDNEIIPVTDPETQSPPGAIAIASIGATAAIILGTLVVTAMDARSVAARS